VIDERRKSQRYSASEAPKDATLKSKKLGEIPASVLNESATGFLIEVDRDVRFRRDLVMQLRTKDGWHDVRVAHREQRDKQTRIGLKRVRDLGHAKEAQRPKEILYSFFYSHIDQSRALVPTLNLALAWILVFVCVSYRFGPSEAAGFTSLGSPAAPRRSPISEADLVESRQLVLDVKKSALEGLAFSPDVAAALELTERQREGIQRIVYPYLESLSDPKLTLRTKQNIVERAYLEVLSQLTPKQQRKSLRGGVAIPETRSS
jgi:hypothetical protein